MNTKRQHQFVGLVIIYTLVLFLSNDAYLPALPQVMKDLGASYHNAQLSLTAWFLGPACIQIFLGPLSDKYGRRPIVLCGAIIFIISTTICAIVPNITLFLLARIFQGASTATMLVAGYACIHEYFETATAIKVLGKMNSVTVLAPALGPLLGVLMLYLMGWRGIFIVLAIIALVCLAGLLKKMPETNTERHPLHISGVLKTYHTVITNKFFLLNSISYCSLFAGLIVWITAGPFIIVDLFKLPTVDFGLYQAIIFGCFILGSLSLKLAVVSRHQKKLRNGFLIVVFIATACAILLSWQEPKILLGFFLPLCIYAFGGGLLMPILSRNAVDACVDMPMGAIMAIQATLLSSFGVISSASVGFFYKHSMLPISVIIFIFATLACVGYKKLG